MKKRPQFFRYLIGIAIGFALCIAMKVASGIFAESNDDD